jgi:23S rRNA (cytidine1920-2'-O)/16S rRNA (cytidine1409-2'-O)-methyltransferase
MSRSYVRLDKLLVDRGLVASRERAQAMILAAKVLVDGQKISKAGHQVAPDCVIELLTEDLPYVSRGGLKLQHAIEFFNLQLAGAVAMDVGASTGGFTDCLLQHAVKRLYAVDVGYGQLAWKLRQDPRVIVLERQNIRYLPREIIPEPLQVATVDTSFISLKLVIPVLLPFLDSSAKLVALIKPQFEVGKGQVGKGGVVRDAELHEQVCRSIERLCLDLGLEVLGITPSPVLGPKGNREFLLAAAKM